MAKLITNSGLTLPRIQQTGKTFERLDPKLIFYTAPPEKRPFSSANF